jgi:acyl-coenzyme A thioesterase PaaI-like protein
MMTLETIQEAFLADVLSIPYSQHLGVVIERDPDGPAQVKIPFKAELGGDGGQVSPAVLFALGDTASAVEMSREMAPRVIELEMGAMFLTASARFHQLAPAHGAIAAETRLIGGLDEDSGRSREARKTTIEVLAEISDESGATVAEYQTHFYIRFMPASQLRALVPGHSEVVEVLNS